MNGRGFGHANVAVMSDFQSYENESSALLERIEQPEQLQLPTFDPAIYSDPQQYCISPDL